MSGWQELLIEVGPDDAEPWSDALLEAGALSVQAEDADAESPDEQPMYGEPGMPAAAASSLPGWRRTILAAMLDQQTDAVRLLDTAARALGMAAPAVREIRTIPDQDWVRLTQSQFEPIPIGERLLIIPRPDCVCSGLSASCRRAPQSSTTVAAQAFWRLLPRGLALARSSVSTSTPRH
jgi:ribosomal protein L11 methyltransferase